MEISITEAIKSIEQEETKRNSSIRFPTTALSNIKIAVRKKLLVLIISVILITIIFVSLLLEKVMQKQNIQYSDNITEELLRKVEFALATEKNIAKTYDMFNMLVDKHLQLCREIAVKIETDSSILETGELKKLVAQTGVDEIHVTDENGIIVYSSTAETEGMIGLNFYKTEQTLPITEILLNSEIEVVQEPRPRGLDGEIAQYISVARKDKKGIIQIGYILPTTDIFGQTKINEFLEILNFPFDGGCIIINDNGKITADSKNILTGKHIENTSLKDIAKKQENSPFYFSLNDSKMRGEIIKYKGAIILGYVNFDHMTFTLLKTSSLIIWFIFFVLLISYAILFLYIIKIVILPLEKMKAEIVDLEQENLLNLKKYLQNKEISTLALEINKMIIRMNYSENSLQKMRKIKKLLQDLLFTESILLRLSNTLLEITNFDAYIPKLISVIESFVKSISKLYRIRVALLDTQKNEMVFRVQQDSSAPIPQISDKDAISCLINGNIFPDKLTQGNLPPVIYCNDTTNEQKYEPMVQAGIKSFAVSSVYVDEHIRAAFVIEIFDKVIEWSEVDKKIIKNACSGISSAIIRKEIEEEKNKILLISEANNRSKAEFLATVSHEIITPINAIIGLSEINTHKYDFPEDIRECFEKILENGMNLLEIVNKIFEFSKIQQNQINLTPKKYLIENMIKEIYKINAKKFENKKVELIFDIDKKIPKTMLGDDEKIMYILNNLISNSLKFTSKGSVIVTLKEESRTGTEIRINFSVKDTGIGIDEESQENIFLKFSQVDSSPSRKYGGIGIGFSIAREFVNIMGGKIEISSKIGEGSNFSFSINQKIIDPTPTKKFKVLGAAEEHKSKDSKNINEQKSPYMPYGKVLIVDDIKANLDIAKELMLCYGLDVDCASNGADAIEKIKNGEKFYDILFIDYMMPEMDGIETTKRIRAINTDYAKNVIIVAFTANITVSEKIFYDNGFNFYISKPISKSKIEDILVKYIHDKQNAKKLNAENKEMKIKKVKPEDIKNNVSDYLKNANIKGLNIKSALNNFGEMEDIYIKCLKSFVKSTPQLLQKTMTVNSETLGEYSILVHGIKGSCYGIGAMECGNEAKELEISAKEGNIERVMLMNKLFIESANTLILEIDKLLTDLDDIKKQNDIREMKEKPDEELLKELLKAVSSYDIDKMNEIIANLDKFIYKQNGELVVFLKEQTANFAYDNIEKKLVAALLE